MAKKPLPIASEAEALFSDQLWRLNNLYWIINEKGERVKFQLNEVQLELYLDLWYMNLVLKSRQHGITTEFCIFMLDTALFNSNTKCGLIAHNRETAEEIFQTKVKYPYEQMDEDIKKVIKATSDTARSFLFSNNSSIFVSTSARGQTLNYLHVSEFGKICRQFPEKAKEIVTGSLNAVHAGQFVSIESTAEGNSGRFYELVQDARKRDLRGEHASMLDFKLFFFPWFRDIRNRLDPTGITITDELTKYFDGIERLAHTKLDRAQRTWYAKKWTIQGEDMKREFPSTPDEAFEVRLEGAYFKSEFERIYKEGRIKSVPHQVGVPVNTYWDIGVNDSTSIWFVQMRGGTYSIIDFLTWSHEGLAYYARVLRDKREKYNYEYGVHVFPHDLEVQEWGTGKTRVEQAKEYGITAKVAPKLAKADQIESARKRLGFCEFDEEKCSEGIKALENYRKEWDPKNGVYRNNPLHDWASDPADAFEVFAVSEDMIDGGIIGYQPKRG